MTGRPAASQTARAHRWGALAADDAGVARPQVRAVLLERGGQRAQGRAGRETAALVDLHEVNAPAAAATPSEWIATWVNTAPAREGAREPSAFVR
jgi:hypothetical protein